MRVSCSREQALTHCNTSDSTPSFAYRHTLQCPATHCDTPQDAARHYNTLQHTTIFQTQPLPLAELLQTATHCNTLQHTVTYATHCATATDGLHSTPPSGGVFSTPHCNTLQHTATHYNTLQHTATHHFTLQHNTILYTTLQRMDRTQRLLLAKLLQRTATRNTLQHTATHCNTPLHTSTQYNPLHHSATDGSHTTPPSSKIAATHCNTQHTATHCNTLQHTGAHGKPRQHSATRCNTILYSALQQMDRTQRLPLLEWLRAALQHTTTYSNTLHHTASHYNTLQHTATHCNTLQHTATSPQMDRTQRLPLPELLRTVTKHGIRGLFCGFVPTLCRGVMGNVAGNFFFLKVTRVSSYYTHLPQTCILHVMMGNVAGDFNVAGFFFQRCVSFLFLHSPCLNWRTHVCTHVGRE